VAAYTVITMWLLPLLTLGLVSVGTFCSGAMTAMAAWTTPGLESGEVWFPLFLMLLGAAGMWGTVRLTPERS
jgi:hypothetical protein